MMKNTFIDLITYINVGAQRMGGDCRSSSRIVSGDPPPDKLQFADLYTQSGCWRPVEGPRGCSFRPRVRDALAVGPARQTASCKFLCSEYLTKKKPVVSFPISRVLCRVQKGAKKRGKKPRNCGIFSLTKGTGYDTMNIHTVILCLLMDFTSNTGILAQDGARVKWKVIQN